MSTVLPRRRRKARVSNGEFCRVIDEMVHLLFDNLDILPLSLRYASILSYRCPPRRS